MAGFRAVDPKQSFPALEERILERWRERDVFARSFADREGAPLWSFYEGPPTANGKPGSHHVLARVFKDIYPRFKTMTGHQVPRKAGWDCHGLPVELEVERELGITSKEEIEEFGIAEFNARCRESVFRYVEDWNRLTERIGFWLDLDDPYVTMTNDYIESVWWALRRMWDDGRLYEDYKVVPYCPRDGTALSSHEVALGYHDVEDPAVYVKLPVRNAESPLEAGDQLLVWTTTPWTLITNAAVAAGPEIEYVRARAGDEVFVLARDRLEHALGEDAEVLDSFPGEALAGASYEPPFDYITDYGPKRTHRPARRLRHHRRGHRHRPHRDRLRRGRLQARGAVRDHAPEPGRPARPLRRADHRLLRPVRQGRRPGDRRGARGEGKAPTRGGLPALLSALLALRHAAPLLRQGELVREDHRGPRPDAGRQRGDRLAPRAHQARALRQVAGGERRLGPVARPLLGHAAADLGVRPERLRRALLRRVDRRAAGEGRRGPGRPPPPLHRRGQLPLRAGGLRRHDAPRRLGDRHLVRLGLDALGAVPLPLRERGDSSRSASPPTSSARRSTRPAAGSTRCSPSRSCSSTHRATATSSAWA